MRQNSIPNPGSSQVIFVGIWKTRGYISCSGFRLDLSKWLRVKAGSKMESSFAKNLCLNDLESNLRKQRWAPFCNPLGTFLAKKDLETMLNFIWLDTDSSLQTNDSKWLYSSSDSTRPNHDSIRKSFGWLWLEGLVTLTRQIWLGHINDCDYKKPLWWLNELSFRVFAAEATQNIVSCNISEWLIIIALTMQKVEIGVVVFYAKTFCWQTSC